MATVELLPMPNGTISPQCLDPDHYQALNAAIANILSLDNARETLAQLFDGIPTLSVLIEARGARNTVGAPVREHKKLCNGAIERADAFISAFDVSALQFDPDAFQCTSPGTDEFKIRLLELVARSIHCIAVSIDKTSEKSHKGNIREAIEYVEPPWTESDSDSDNDQPRGKRFELPSLPPFDHLFFSCWYMNVKDYPFGPSDMAGYWAEDRIFGGVVLFDRGESGKEAKSVWFHSGRHEWTKRIWKPLDWQWTSMTEFLLHGPQEIDNTELAEWEAQLTKEIKERMKKQWKSEFPYFCDIDNPVRHDSRPAMSTYNIYRDKWERDLSRDNTSNDPHNEFDYPGSRAIFNILLNEAGFYHEQPTGKTEHTSKDDHSDSHVIGTFDEDGFHYAEHHTNRLTESEMNRGAFDRPRRVVSESHRDIDEESDLDYDDAFRRF